MTASVSPEDPTTWTSLDMLASCYDNQKKYKLAEPLLVEALEGRRRALGNETPETLGTMASLGWLRVRCGMASEAEPLLRECLEIRKKTMPDNWLRFNTESLLGVCLVGEKKYDEAEPRLISSYQGLKDRENKLPPSLKPRVSEAAERVVRLYDAWGKKEKAGEWRKKLSSSSSPPAVAPKP
jgi:eukaryotic-like serine/threonine-protein kinase